MSVHAEIANDIELSVKFEEMLAGCCRTPPPSAPPTATLTPTDIRAAVRRRAADRGTGDPTARRPTRPQKPATPPARRAILITPPPRPIKHGPARPHSLTGDHARPRADRTPHTSLSPVRESATPTGSRRRAPTDPTDKADRHPGSEISGRNSNHPRSSSPSHSVTATRSPGHPPSVRSRGDTICAEGATVRDSSRYLGQRPDKRPHHQGRCARRPWKYPPRPFKKRDVTGQGPLTATGCCDGTAPAA